MELFGSPGTCDLTRPVQDLQVASTSACLGDEAREVEFSARRQVYA